MRASERYLVLEFGFNLNQGCSWVGTAFPHLFFSTILQILSPQILKPGYGPVVELF